MDKMLQEKEAELEEFQQSSREYEAELEAQLSQSEKTIKELTSVNQRLNSENEAFKAKLCTVTADSQKQILELQSDLKETKTANERLITAIRELEQFNDDLERSKRSLAASLDDFEHRLTEQIEKNAMLENELGEKDELEVIVQRLKDEAKELRQELLVQQAVPQVQQSPSSVLCNSSSSDKNYSLTGGMTASQLSRQARRASSLNSPSHAVLVAAVNGLNMNNSTSMSNALNNNNNVLLSKTKTTTASLSSESTLSNSTVSNGGQVNGHHTATNGSAKAKFYFTGANGMTTSNRTSPASTPSHVNVQSGTMLVGGATPQSGHPHQTPLPLLSPSTRISALNIVSDLLRKVGALESKLASCRNLVPPGTPKTKSATGTPVLASPSSALKDIDVEIDNKEN